MIDSCKNCGNDFEKTRKWQKYCSAKCRYSKWNMDNPRTRAESSSYFASQQIIDKRTLFGFGITRKYHPYRSELELLYAEHLADCDIEFEYEPQAFEIKDENGIKLHYIPDFYLPESDKYIEIKKRKDQIKNHKKITLFKEQYPSIKYEILTLTDLEDMKVLNPPKSLYGQI